MFSVSRRSLSGQIARRTFVFSVAFTLLHGLAAGETTIEFTAHLESGELGLARELALKTNDALLRQKRLTRVAGLQMKVRAADAAWRTLRTVSNGHLGEQQSLSQSLTSITNGGGRGGGGGAAMADFDTLINLIESTVQPDGWETNGGNGAIEPYPAGVFVDAKGTLHRSERISAGALARLRERAIGGRRMSEMSQESSLRLISLRGLQDEISRCYLSGEKWSDEMRYLAGLHRAKYVFVDTERRDILIGGPAGKLQVGESGRIMHVASGEPALHLDDWLVLLRTIERRTPFGCNIKPREPNLKKVQEYLDSQTGSLKPGGRAAWLAGIQNALGQQDIEVFGLAPNTHAAQVLVEADHHMKLIGIGLESGVDGLKSYISTVELDKDGKVPPMSVLRWWFTMNYDSVTNTATGDAFELLGTGVQVLSENELLTKRGERVHTGDSELLNKAFAKSFTDHFEQLASKYPVYGELRNVFDLTLIATLVQEHDLEIQGDLSLDRFRNEVISPNEHVTVSKEVSTVANSRVIEKRQIVGVVSGGVHVDAKSTASQSKVELSPESDELLTKQCRRVSEVRRNHWWWDVD